jgi:signal transduction histidine kinase
MSEHAVSGHDVPAPARRGPEHGARSWTGRRRWLWCQRHADPAAAVLIVSATIILATVAAGSPAVVAAVTACLAGVGLAVWWRRRFPVAVAVAAAVLLVIPLLVPGGYSASNELVGDPAGAAVFLIALALGSDCRWRRSLWGLAPLTAAMAANGSGFNPFLEMLTIGPWLAGLVVASRRRVGEQLELRARELEEERELFALVSVRYERARIARELHDVVAHCVSLMVVQANAGVYLAKSDPGSAAESFDSISDTARQASAEIERLVAVLGTSSPASPPAGLRIVEDLVRRVRDSGLRVTCRLSGDTEGLSEPAVETVYRLVQEAITNAVKHAPGAPIEIRLDGQGKSILAEVTNQPAAGARSGLEDTGGGHGLDGMRERVRRCGGTFSAGPTAERSWRVRATLPRHPSPGPPPATRPAR